MGSAKSIVTSINICVVATSQNARSTVVTAIKHDSNCVQYKCGKGSDTNCLTGRTPRSSALTVLYVLRRVNNTCHLTYYIRTYWYSRAQWSTLCYMYYSTVMLHVVHKQFAYTTGAVRYRHPAKEKCTVLEYLYSYRLFGSG